jgi:hypothetical protein
MTGRGTYAAAQAANRAATWGILNEDSALVQPLRILGQEAEAFSQVADTRIASAYSHLTRPYTARSWYKYPAGSVDGTTFNSGVQLSGDSHIIREASTLLDFKEAPPTEYLPAVTWVQSLSLTALSGLTVVDFHYIKNLFTALSTEAQDAVVFLTEGTATVDPTYYIYYEDGTTHSIPITSRRNSFETQGIDERVSPTDFAYTPTRTVDPRIDNIKLLDLFRSTSTASVEQNIASFATADLPVPGALTGELTLITTFFSEDAEAQNPASYPNIDSGWTKGGFQDYWSDGSAGGAPHTSPPDGSMHMKFHCNTFYAPGHTTGFTLTSGVEYNFSFKGKAEYSGRFEVWVGPSGQGGGTPKPSWFNGGAAQILSSGYGSYSFDFTPDTTDTYYVYWQGYNSNANTDKMWLDSLLVEATSSAPPTITLPSTEFTFNTYTIPEAGRTEANHCWVDTDGLLHVKFETTELTAQLADTSISYMVTAAYDGTTLSLYIDGVLQSTAAYAATADLVLVPIAQWGAADGLVGPTSYWNRSWDAEESLFTYEHPGITPVHSPGSLLLDTNLISKFTLQERTGATAHDVANPSNDIDLTKFTSTWSESSDFPSLVNYNYIKHALGVHATSVDTIPKILADEMTIEINFSGITANGTVLHLYADADNSIRIRTLTSGGSIYMIQRSDGTEYATAVATLTAGNPYTLRLRSLSGTISVEVAGQTKTQSVGAFTAINGTVHVGNNYAGDDEITGTHSINLVALASGTSWTATIQDDASKRPAPFQQQWVNDEYDGKLRNLVNNSYDLTIVSSDSTSYIPSIQSGYWDYKTGTTNIPAQFYHIPYLVDGELYPVLPGNIWAIQYDYLPITTPSAFVPKMYGHGYKQPAGKVFESLTSVLNAPISNTDTLLYRVHSRKRVEIEDSRVQNGTTCVVSIEGTKLSTTAWADSSVDFTATIVDANLVTINASMVRVYSGSQIIEATVTVSGNSIHIVALDEGALSVTVRYRASTSATKTASRVAKSAAVVLLVAGDTSAYETQRDVVITNVALSTTPTYSTPSPSPQEHYINETLGKVYGQLCKVGTDSHLAFMHSPDGEAVYTKLRTTNTPISTRHFYDHWAVLNDNNTLSCHSAKTGSIHWSYSLNVRPAAGYAPVMFDFSGENDIYVLYSDGTDFAFKSFAPRYDYAMIFQEADIDNTDNIKLTLFTRYEYDQVQIDLEGTPDLTKGYLLYAEGPELA